MPHDMLVGSAIFLAREDLDLKSMLQSKHLGRTLTMNNMQMFFNLNEILLNIYITSKSILKNKIIFDSEILYLKKVL